MCSLTWYHCALHWPGGTPRWTFVIRSPRLRAIPCVFDLIRMYPASFPPLSSFFSTDTFTSASSPKTLTAQLIQESLDKGKNSYGPKLNAGKCIKRAHLQTYLLAYKLAAKKLPFSELSWGVRQRMLVEPTTWFRNSTSSVILVAMATLFSHSNSAHMDLNISSVQVAGRM